jgi:hypothetical protein
MAKKAEMAAEAQQPGEGDLRVELVDIDSLRPWEGNPRKGDHETIEASLRRFGQQRPVLATDSGLIVVGANTWTVMKDRLGWSRCKVMRTDLPEDEAIAYLVADNRAADRAEYDDRALVEVLAQVGGGIPSEGLAGTGFSSHDLQDLLDRVAPAPPEEFPAVGGGDGSGGVETEHECPRCHYKFS